MIRALELMSLMSVDPNLHVVSRETLKASSRLHDGLTSLLGLLTNPFQVFLGQDRRWRKVSCDLDLLRGLAHTQEYGQAPRKSTMDVNLLDPLVLHVQDHVGAVREVDVSSDRLAEKGVVEDIALLQTLTVLIEQAVDTLTLARHAPARTAALTPALEVDPALGGHVVGRLRVRGLDEHEVPHLVILDEMAASVVLTETEELVGHWEPSLESYTKPERNLH